ncbi:hypothetical protein [Bradyrhizobium sp. AUGA SZCCT0042]|uniref:hypothetical protein n=1 Tax=Bradyrhizobium sp. AUGA SZCCT0042 TaxID=2807651 RepID=UPI001BA85919|nr:hypothetical protein [Bradyrhizobium sp. AUGA SZCCT0042]MBR1301769.1 hypothetical protein [Bradyrhizobium sp. AUGA SZCCT0042]
MDVNANTDSAGGTLTINIIPIPTGYFVDADNNATAMPLIECEPLEEPVHVAMPEPGRQDEPVAPGVVRLWPRPK